MVSGKIYTTSVGWSWKKRNGKWVIVSYRVMIMLCLPLFQKWDIHTRRKKYQQVMLTIVLVSGCSTRARFGEKSIDTFKQKQTRNVLSPKVKSTWRSMYWSAREHANSTFAPLLPARALKISPFTLKRPAPAVQAINFAITLHFARYVMGVSFKKCYHMNMGRFGRNIKL